jgi:hypothetical protein
VKHGRHTLRVAISAGVVSSTLARGEVGQSHILDVSTIDVLTAHNLLAQSPRMFFS